MYRKLQVFFSIHASSLASSDKFERAWVNGAIWHLVERAKLISWLLLLKTDATASANWVVFTIFMVWSVFVSPLHLSLIGGWRQRQYLAKLNMSISVQFRDIYQKFGFENFKTWKSDNANQSALELRIISYIEFAIGTRSQIQNTHGDVEDI